MAEIVTLTASKKMVGLHPKPPRPLSGMVGATGIEPVTPTMSIVVDAKAAIKLIEICS